MDRGGHLLWWGVLDEVDALFDVALEALGASFKELLLLIGDTVEHVSDLFGTIGLYIVLAGLDLYVSGWTLLTPRVTRVEKNSTPVALAISSPPAIPGR
jgi:hypothetical protein